MADGELTAFDVREARQQLTRIADALEAHNKLQAEMLALAKADVATRKEAEQTRLQYIKADMEFRNAQEARAAQDKEMILKMMFGGGAPQIAPSGDAPPVPRTRRHRHQPTEPPEAA